jgi:hypothetical protein
MQQNTRRNAIPVCDSFAEQHFVCVAGPATCRVPEDADLVSVAPEGALRLRLCVLQASTLKACFGAAARRSALQKDRVAVLGECFGPWQCREQELQRGCLFVKVWPAAKPHLTSLFHSTLQGN